jgi:hypothetical protein
MRECIDVHTEIVRKLSHENEFLRQENVRLTSWLAACATQDRYADLVASLSAYEFPKAGFEDPLF